MRALRLLPVAGLLFLQVVFASAQELPVELVAEPVYVEGKGFGASPLFHDTDHNGRLELIFQTNLIDGCCTVRFYEATEQGDYVEVHSMASTMPSAAGDFDGDGKTEFLIQNGRQIRFLESVHANAFPSATVWEGGDYSDLVRGYAVADSDGDGLQECIFVSDRDLIILENYADDRWHEQFNHRLFPYPGGTGYNTRLFVSDFDGDGAQDIAIAASLSVPPDPDLPGVLIIVESSTNDRWHERGRWDVLMAAPEHLTGGLDTDGNGRPELMIAGGPEPGPQAVIFEAHGNDRYWGVEAIHTPGPAAVEWYEFDSFHALCKLDGVRRDEYVVEKDAFLYVYRPTSPGAWSLATTIDARDWMFTHTYDYRSAPLYGFGAGDLNRNGRDELVWMRRGGHEALFLEVPDGVTDAPAVRAGFSVTAVPNPTSGSTVLYLRGTTSARSRIRIVDARGRVVRTLEVDNPSVGGLGVVWNGTDESGVPVASGVYRVAVSDGGATGSSKLTIVR